MSTTTIRMCLRKLCVSIVASSSITYVLCGLIALLATHKVSAFQIQAANFSIDGFVDSHEVRFIWSVPNFEGIARFILVHKQEGSNSRTITEIEPEYTMYTLRDLKELTTYLVYLETVYKNGTTVRSYVLTFQTPEQDFIIPPSRGGKPPEAWRAGKVIVLCIVGVVWIGLIAMFFKQWGIIRMFLPYAARVKYTPRDTKAKTKRSTRRFGIKRGKRRNSNEHVVAPVVILETNEHGGTRAVMDTSV